MAKEPNLLPLKILVISLGFLLAGGAVFVLSTLAHKANEISNQPCKDVTVSLAALHVKGTVIAATRQGGELMVTVEDAPNHYVLTIDNCSGKLLRTTTITP